MNSQFIAAKIPLLLVTVGILLLGLGILAARGTTGYDTVLAVPTAGRTPTTPPNMNDKYADDRLLYADLTEIAQTPEAIRTQIPFPTLPPQPSWPPGVPYRAAGIGFILFDGQAPISSSDYKGGNKWLATLADRRIVVFAGAEGYRGDPSQGLLLVYVKNLAGDTIDAQQYLTPRHAGAVQIVDVADQRLQLQAADGTTFYFDIPTRQWVTP